MSKSRKKKRERYTNLQDNELSKFVKEVIHEKMTKIVS